MWNGSTTCHVTEETASGERGPVTLVRVDGDHLDLRAPLGRLSGQPDAQVNGVAAFEHVEDLSRGDIHDRGHEPAPPPPVCGLHHRLVEPDHRGRPDPISRVDASPAVAFDRRPDRRPRHSELAGDRCRRPLEGADSVGRPRTRLRVVSTRRAPARSDVSVQVLDLAVRIRTRPDPLPPSQLHRPATRRRVAQAHPPAVLRLRAACHTPNSRPRSRSRQPRPPAHGRRR